MAIIYKDPKQLFKNDDEILKWEKWADYKGGIYEFWHDGFIIIKKNYKSTKRNADQNSILSYELVNCLNIIRNYLFNKINEFEFDYPVKYAEIGFIYKDEAYQISPHTFALHEIEKIKYCADAFFEKYEKEIRKILEKELKIVYTRYIGFLD